MTESSPVFPPSKWDKLRVVRLDENYQKRKEKSSLFRVGFRLVLTPLEMVNRGLTGAADIEPGEGKRSPIPAGIFYYFAMRGIIQRI
jgi:hypothetical protein